MNIDDLFAMERALYPPGGVTVPAGSGFGAATLFTATGAAASQNLLNRFANVINVKDDFGAKGDGTTDDTTAIQNAFDAAFGTAGSPHGQSSTLNKPVYFPPGTYKVTSTLVITAVRAGLIFGAGRGTSILQWGGSVPGNPTYTPVLTCNGIGYSRIENMTFRGSANAVNSFTIAFDLNWDGVSPQGTTNNTFVDCWFDNATYGLYVGRGNAQADLATFIDCVWSNCNWGFYNGNQNVVGNRIYGGTLFGNVAAGIYVPLGTFGAIENISGSFNGVSSGPDISVAQGGCIISGIRSENNNFMQLNGAGPFIISGCFHQPASSNFFINVNGATEAVIESCFSTLGTISVNSNAQCIIKDSQLGTTNALTVAGELIIQNSRFGDQLVGNSVHRYIKKQVINAQGTRTFDIEASSLSDIEFLYESRTLYSTGANSVNFTVTIGSPAVFTLVGHSFALNDAIAFTTTGALPTGLSLNTTYYVIPINVSTFNVSTTKNGAAVNTSGSQSGTHSLWLVRKYAKGDTVLNNTVAAAGSPGWICTTAGRAVTTADAEGTAVFKAMANVAA